MSKPIKALRDMRNKCNVISWMGSWLGKMEGNLNKTWTLVYNNMQIFFY